MSRQMTQKLLDANRKNAQKSTGPRTPEGKARSSRNSTVHGLFSRDLVLTHGPAAEDPSEFDAIRQSFYADFRPASGIERALVEQLAACCWRSRRAQRFEAAALARTSSDHVKSVDESRATLASQQALLDAKSSILEKIKFIRSSFLEHPEPGDPIGYQQFQDNIIASAQHMEMPLGNRTPEELLPEVLDNIQKRITELSMWVDTHRSIVATLHHRIAIHTRLSETGDLPENEILQKLLRYESLNDRQFHRTLNQLVGHQRKIPLTTILKEIQSQNPQLTPLSHNDSETGGIDPARECGRASLPASRGPQPEPPCHSERSEESHLISQQASMASRSSANPSSPDPESQIVDSNPSAPDSGRASLPASRNSAASPPPDLESQNVDSNPSAPDSGRASLPASRGPQPEPPCHSERSEESRPSEESHPSSQQSGMASRNSADSSHPQTELQNVDSNPSFNATPIENRQSTIANRQFQRTR